jgi:3',5'-cyclic AMP phosphodiesterase CpdA
MLSILHISDLHFGPPYRPQVGAAVLRIVPELQPDVIVVSGDLTQRAKPEQFAAAREFLDGLPPVPQVIVPGNHDVPLYRVRERLFDPHKNYRAFIARELNQVHRFRGAVIAALDSTAPRQSISNGRIHRNQLEFCEHAFHDTAPETVHIVVAHHHFAPAPDYERDQTMPKAKRALNRFVDLNVDLILGGHLHRAYIGNSLDVFPGSHLDQGIIIVQCGTTTSGRGRARERAKNSFNLIRVGETMLSVTHFIHCSKSGDFIPASRHVFPRPGQRFAEEHIANVAICESTDEAESTVAEARCEQKYEQENPP